ncbi:lactonase family protein [Neolewinella maritima]|nr:lactonase family protein [Neolewinella maritima]
MRYLLPALLSLLLALSCTVGRGEDGKDGAPGRDGASAAGFFLGTYNDDGVHEPGIYHFTLNSDGTLTNNGRVAEASSPSFLAYTPDRSRLVAVEEVNGGGSVASFRVNGSDLELLNRRPTSAPGPCHINVTRDGYVTVATYGGGTLELWRLATDGVLSERLDVQDHRARGAETPHAHSSYYLNDDTEVLAVDLGTDEVWHYTLDKRANTLRPATPPAVKMEDGAGPRHLTIHPNGKWIYVINELNSTVTQIAMDGTDLSVVESWSTLPDDFTGESFCADIHVSSDGRFLYGSNRGHNSIVVYSIDAGTGALTALEHESVAGDWPRNFALSPDEAYLLVANQRSKNITTLARNQQTGMLDFVTRTTAPIPVCILF